MKHHVQKHDYARYKDQGIPESCYDANETNAKVKSEGPVFCVSKSFDTCFWDEVDRRKQMEITYASNGKISNCFLYVKLGDLDLHATSQLRLYRIA